MTQEGDRSGDQLQVAIREQTAYIRLKQRGSFKISKALKTFGVSAMEQGVDTIVVDLAQCVGMDSTFMGVLAGLAFRLRQKGGKGLYMVNLSARTRGLLATLGLDQLVKPCMAGALPQEFADMLGQDNELAPLPATESARRETAAMMLEAHENLVELSPENLPRFKDVLTFLREDLKKSAHDEQAAE